LQPEPWQPRSALLSWPDNAGKYIVLNKKIKICRNIQEILSLNKILIG